MAQKQVAALWQNSPQVSHTCVVLGKAGINAEASTLKWEDWIDELQIV